MATAQGVEHDIGTELRDLLADIASFGAEPVWAPTAPLLTPTPRPNMTAHRWSGRDLRSLCDRARQLVPMDAGGDRRAITLANPGLGGAPFATPTVSCAYQTLGPQEIAPPHRHTPAAIRFILEGSGVWTTVQGDSLEMRTGDLVLTPSWAFHDHRNETDSTMTWFDALDLPLVRALDAVFFEPHPSEPLPPAVESKSEARYTATGIVIDEPAGTDRAVAPGLNVFRWANTDAALKSEIDRSQKGWAAIRFVNPATGASALPTLGCRMLRIAPKGRTPKLRRTGSGVIVVYRGAGWTDIDGQRFEWEPGDIISVPSWTAVQHGSESGADLFSVSDAPALRAIGLYREVVVAD